MNLPVTPSAICNAFGGVCKGNASISLAGIAPLGQAQKGHIAYCRGASNHQELAITQAGCAVVGEDVPVDLLRHIPCTITTDNPHLYHARLTQWWVERMGAVPSLGIHSSAVVHPKAQVDASASIGPLCVVEEGACIGPHTVLHARVFVGARCQIGAHCVLHSGAVIGADGFGFANTDAQGIGGQWIKIAHLGAVQIHDHVEIGANTCVDRGAMEDTIIEEGVKIDNLVQVAHNVRIGRHTAIAGQSGIAGSTHIGSWCTLAGASKVIGHLTLADHVHISGAAVVPKSLKTAGRYSGVFPLDTHEQWEKNAATLKQLHQMRERLRRLERLVQKLSLEGVKPLPSAPSSNFSQDVTEALS